MFAVWFGTFRWTFRAGQVNQVSGNDKLKRMAWVGCVRVL